MTKDTRPGAKITFTDGTVEYRVGLPSEIAREVRATDPTAVVAPRRVHEFPIEAGGTVGAPIEVGTVVYVTHIGVTKTGRVVKVTPTKVHVEVATYGGKETKVIVRPKAEVRV